MSDFLPTHICSLFNDGRLQHPKRTCIILRPADTAGFLLIQYGDGTTGVVQTEALTPIVPVNSPKPTIKVEGMNEHD